jgi:hypothetical protein
MSRWKLALAGMVILPLLGACHGDIFSIKPETNATVPQKAPEAETAPEADSAGEAETPTQ